jgi:hypothetical protein
MTETKSIPKQFKNRYLLNSNKRSVQFQLLNVNVEKGVCPRANVPGRDTIWDEKKSESYQIYHQPKTKVEDGVQKTTGSDIWIGPETMGMVHCNLNDRRGYEMYEYLCMSNYNASNPFRDKNVKPIFRMVDVEVEAKKEIELEEKRIEAQAMVIKKDTEGLRMLADWAGMDSTNSPTVLKRNLMSLAKNRTNDFFDIVSVIDEYGEYVSSIIRGQKHHIIEPARTAGKWRWADTKTFFAPYNQEDEHSVNVISLAKYFKEGDGSGKHYKRLTEKLKEFKGLYEV